jgi:hypothetical protein
MFLGAADQHAGTRTPREFVGAHIRTLFSVCFIAHTYTKAHDVCHLWTIQMFTSS